MLPDCFYIGRFRIRGKSQCKIVIGLLILSLALIQCTDPEPSIEREVIEPVEFVDPLEGIPDNGPISFVSPSIGQRSYFVLFEATLSRPSGNVNFEYLPDTLVLAITGKESDAWVVSEFLTEKSNSRLKPEDSYWGNWGDTLFTTYIRFELDSIHFYRDSDKLYSSFALHREQKFPLQLISDEFPQNPNGLPFFGGSAIRWMEFTKDYTHFGKTFERLNMYFNYVEMTTDGYGFTYVYSPSDAIVRCAWVNAWSIDEAAGWDLLPR